MCTSGSAANNHLRQYGSEVQAAIQKWPFKDKSAFSQVISLTYTFIDIVPWSRPQPGTRSTASASDEAAETGFADQVRALEVELSGQACCLGSCEWLCQGCWKQVISGFPQLHHDWVGPSVAVATNLNQQQRQQQQKGCTLSSLLSRLQKSTTRSRAAAQGFVEQQVRT